MGVPERAGRCQASARYPRRPANRTWPPDPPQRIPVPGGALRPVARLPSSVSISPHPSMKPKPPVEIQGKPSPNPPAGCHHQPSRSAIAPTSATCQTVGVHRPGVKSTSCSQDGRDHDLPDADTDPLGQVRNVETRPPTQFGQKLGPED